MDHATCRERLVDLRYGELSRREAREVEAHLAGCAGCRAERDRLAGTVEALRGLTAPPPPERGDRVLLAAARAAAEARRRDSVGLALRGFSLRVAIGTAFAVVATLGVVRVGMQRHAPLTEGRPPVAEVGPVAGAPPPPPAPLAQAVPPRPAQPPSASATSGAPARAKVARAAAPSPVAAGKPAPAPQAAPPSAAVASREAPAPADAVEEQEFWAAQEAREGNRARERDQQLPARDVAGGVAGGVAQAEAKPEPAPKAEPKAEALAKSAAKARPTAVASARAAPAAPAAAAVAPGFAAAPAAPAAPPLGALAQDVERRRGAGELAELQRTFEPCPGGDLRRHAWADEAQRVLKLMHERAGGVRVEEWFDEDGRLREARVTGPGASGPHVRQVRVDADGREAVAEVGEPASGDAAPPPLVRRDPSRAFFGGPGCQAAAP